MFASAKQTRRFDLLYLEEGEQYIKEFTGSVHFFDVIANDYRYDFIWKPLAQYLSLSLESKTQPSTFAQEASSLKSRVTKCSNLSTNTYSSSSTKSQTFVRDNRVLYA
jgi:hypothetical protein